jgi:peptidoglycan LD-endopeptidase LytH
MTALATRLDRLTVSSPLPFDLNRVPGLALDLSDHNPRLQGFDPADTAAFSRWVDQERRRAGAVFAAGGYGENRGLYRLSRHFDGGGGGAGARTLHLGIDLWLEAGTAVHAVLPGVVHSTADNARFGDYGPTLILEHRVDGAVFHTLYGHLARRSLEQTRPGQVVAAGACLGWLGEPTENLGWPPHLHFQIIEDLEGQQGDYPGVCRPEEAARYLANCPDPNHLLRLQCLPPSSEPRP